MGPTFSLLLISFTHMDILTIDGPETRNTSCKQDKDFGLSYKIFQSHVRRNVYSGRKNVQNITTAYFGK